MAKMNGSHPLGTLNVTELLNCTESVTSNCTHIGDSSIGTAAVYRAEDFAAMACVFTFVLILSFLWQRKMPPFCCIRRTPLLEETYEGVMGYQLHLFGFITFVKCYCSSNEY